jgi:peptide/nickel transport system permease protein
MRRYVLTRVGQAVLTIFVVATFNFFLFRILPGNPLRLIAREGRLNAETVETLRQSFGLDQSLFEQYVLYLKNLLTFSLGFSYVSRRPVEAVVGETLGNTLILTFAGAILIVAGGILLGVIAGSRRGSRTDEGIVTTSLALWSLPTFWVGLMLILFFSIWIQAFPISGIHTPGALHSSIFDNWADIAHHTVLPAFTLALVSIGQVTMVMRASLAEVLDEDFVVTARAKGLKARRVLWRHAVPNAFLPTFTLTTLYIGLLMAGAIQVETVFSWPGIGRLMYTSVLARDYPVLEGTFLVIAIIVIVSNLVTDLVYTRLDPRITIP